VNSSPVLLRIAKSIAWITLNRPQVLNAENMAWIEALDAAIGEIATTHAVRVVVLRGAGRAFCAGIDLEMLSREGMPDGFYEGQERAFRALETLNAITIAGIHGHCLGGGVQLAISCDIRVSSDDCGIGLPAVNEGLFPGMAPYRLPKLIGLGPARRLILSGEVIRPDEALRLGLVDYVVPSADFDLALGEIAQRFAHAPPTAATASKRLIRLSETAGYEDVYEASLPMLEACLASPEVAAARLAWRGRHEATEK
jgi:enoyl-CoA hydratase/carnithine racemase